MNEQKTIKELTDVELKAIAFDEMNRMATSKNNIDIINAELSSRDNTVPVEEPKKEEDKK